MLLSGSLRLDDWTIGLMQRWSAPLLWLSGCSLYWLSSAPTCSWSLNGLGRKLECNHARYWEDRAKTPGEQTTVFNILLSVDITCSAPSTTVWFYMNTLLVCECFPWESMAWWCSSSQELFQQKFLIRQSPESQDFPTSPFLLAFSGFLSFFYLRSKY